MKSLMGKHGRKGQEDENGSRRARGAGRGRGRSVDVPLLSSTDGIVMPGSSLHGHESSEIGHERMGTSSPHFKTDCRNLDDFKSPKQSDGGGLAEQRTPLELLHSMRISPAPGFRGLSLSSLVRSAPQNSASVRMLPCGGVEAVPLVDGNAVTLVLREAGFENIPQLLHEHSDKSAILSSSDEDNIKQNLSHANLADFVSSGSGLWECGVSVGDRCGILLPNGPEMACCMISCLSCCVAVPINLQQTVSEVIQDLMVTGAKAIIMQQGEDDKG